METYCVREKKKTKCVPGSDEIIKARKWSPDVMLHLC